MTEGGTRRPNQARENWRGTVENLMGLLEDQKGQFSFLMKEYEDILAVNSSDLGKSDLMEHEHEMNTDHLPIKPPQSCVLPHQRERD